MYYFTFVQNFYVLFLRDLDTSRVPVTIIVLYCIFRILSPFQRMSVIESFWLLSNILIN